MRLLVLGQILSSARVPKALAKIQRATPISLLCVTALPHNQVFQTQVLQWAEDAGVHYWVFPPCNNGFPYNFSISALNFTLPHHTRPDLVLLAGNSKRTSDMRAQLRQPPAREYILLS